MAHVPLDDSMSNESDAAGSAPPTRTRVLDAACELFSRNGFKGTTHQDICTRADANIAAINYYFGNKESVYEAAFEQAWTRSLIAAELKASRTSTPEEAMRRYLRAEIEAMLSPGPTGWLPRLIYHEMTAPTPLARLVHERYVRPVVDRLQTIVAEYLGAGGTRDMVYAGVFCVRSQALHVAVSLREGPDGHPLTELGEQTPASQGIVPGDQGLHESNAAYAAEGDQHADAAVGDTPLQRACGTTTDHGASPLVARITAFCLGGLEQLRDASKSHP